MKKLAIASMVILLLGTLVFAAGAKESGPKKLTLALWDEYQKPAIQKIVDKYNASQSNVQVEIELTPWGSYWTKLDAAAGSGEAPDVFWMNTYLPKYVEGDILVPLDEFIKRDKIDMNSYVDATVEMSGYKGEQWGMPKGLDSVAVALNLDIFNKIGRASCRERV